MQPNISRRSVTSLLCGVLVLAVCTTAVARTGNSTSGPGADNDPIDATLLSATTSWVVAENRKPGTRAWRIPKWTPSRIEGFADHVSAKRGNRVRLFVSTSARHFHVEAFRFGYYGGDGARLVWRSGRLEALPGVLDHLRLGPGRVSPDARRK